MPGDASEARRACAPAVGCGRGRARAQATEEEARPARGRGLADAAPAAGRDRARRLRRLPQGIDLLRAALDLRDSDEYTRIPRAETGVRPEDGWEIEDCYILER